MSEIETPLCQELQASSLDSNDIRAWRSLAYRLERGLNLLAEREALSNLVSLLLQTMEPIGPMRDRKDYPPELQTAINVLRSSPESPAKGSQICKSCHGSGTVRGMTYGRGPDDYETDVTCLDCNGTGESPAKEQPGEQNAAPAGGGSQPVDTSTERDKDHVSPTLQGQPGHEPRESPILAVPQVAAPDIAAMANRLRDQAVTILATGHESVGLDTIDLLREAAALIERLGQGWIPVSPVAEYQDGSCGHQGHYRRDQMNEPNPLEPRDIMSETPRTDAFWESDEMICASTEAWSLVQNFARQLERELAEEKTRHEQTDQRWMELGAKYERALTQAQARCAELEKQLADCEETLRLQA